MPIFFKKKSCNRGVEPTPELPLTVKAAYNICVFWLHLIELNFHKLVRREHVWQWKWISSLLNAMIILLDLPHAPTYCSKRYGVNFRDLHLNIHKFSRNKL